MLTVACAAGSRLVSSFVCTSRPLLHSVAQQCSLFQSRTTGPQAWTGHRGSQSVFASGDRSSAKPSPSRGVVRDEVEGIPVGEYGERILVPNHNLVEEEEEDDILEGIRVEYDSKGYTFVLPKVKSLSDESNGGYMRCDLSGCYFTPEAPVKKTFEVIEGDGWRLGYESAPESQGSFCAVVGAGGWSVALTSGEFNDFCILIQSVRKGIITMDDDSVYGRDDIVVQIERGTIWMQCTLPKTRLGSLQLLWQPGVPDNLLDSHLKQAFEVRFILSGDDSKRQAEGYWPPEAVFDMLKKIDSSSVNPSEVSFTEPAGSEAAAV